MAKLVRENPDIDRQAAAAEAGLRRRQLRFSQPMLSLRPLSFKKNGCGYALSCKLLSTASVRLAGAKAASVSGAGAGACHWPPLCRGAS
jgi:hypothetical protein